MGVLGPSVHLGMLLTAVGFGFRHGIDWDHLAALTDLTSTQESPRRAIGLATFYAVGHAMVVLALGLVAILLSDELPASVDAVMQRVVGASLVGFGAFVLISLARRGRRFRMQSRWMLLIRAARRALRRPEVVVIEHDHPVAAQVTARAGDEKSRPSNVHRHVLAMPVDPFERTSRSTALAVGMLHGIGGETPTQVMIFAAAAGARGPGASLLLLGAFLVGLLASNTVVAVVSAFGFLHATRHWRVYATVTAVTGAVSLVVGALFLLGHSAALPALSGG